MIAFQVEPVKECWDEVYPLTRNHWEGTKTYRRHEPFNPDRERFIAYNEMNFFHLVTARDGGKLVGYFGVYVTKSMHSQLTMATEDTLYLHPDYRVGRVALRFLLYIEQYLKPLGVWEILFSCEIDNKSGIRKLLEYLGYEAKILQFSKHLLPPSADSATTVSTVGAYDPPQTAAR